MPTPPGLLRQAAAIPVRAGQVCLVSSRSGKRWVIPKGCLEPGKTAGEIALQESWEEAGLTGVLSPEPVGSYIYEKAGLTCHVVVFLLQVAQAVDDFPEREVRERVWVNFGQVLQRVEDPGLREVLRGVIGQKAG
jgi:8-oxo-dGTP pyrophosphatase MutT (NUDIX family)